MTEDLKVEYVKKLNVLPFKAYVAITECSRIESYSDAYIRLVNAIIRCRLVAIDGLVAHFHFEQNSKVSLPLIKCAINEAVEKLRSEGNQRPYTYCIDSVSKPNMGVSVPDFLLGVLGKYLMSGVHKGTGSPPREHMIFEHLRDKFKVVLDVDTGEKFSRRNPIKPLQ